MNPLDLISAHPWQRAFFTTYALSLSFFEAVLLDALVRGGGREALVFADVEGVRSALGEQGARRVGRDYEVEPVSLDRGIFHPKLSVLTSESECHLLVGSGNLTFNGWGGNLEVVEHLHPGFAPDAVNDAADFFEYLAIGDGIRHGAGEQCGRMAAELRRHTAGKAGNRDIRLFHSLDVSISEKIKDAVDGLGGAKSMIVAAPFWDGGNAVDLLCKEIGLDSVFVHSHAGGTVEGKLGANWPSRAKTSVHAVEVVEFKEEKPRRLHAKALEIMCNRGRLLVSGSANATVAALGGNRNVEACVARMQRDRTVGWEHAPSFVPDPVGSVETDAKDDAAVTGILRAVLEGDCVKGQVLTKGLGRTVSVFLMASEGPCKLGEAELSTELGFRVHAPDLEMQSWKGGRFALRLEDTSGNAAEGFVSIAAFNEIARRAGAIGPKLLALMMGNETPADVAAIMTWFHDDPSRMGNAALSFGGGGHKADDKEEARLVDVFDLGAVRQSFPGEERNSSGEAGWQRFMRYVFSALSEKRGPMEQSGGKHDEDENEGAGQTGGTDNGSAAGNDKAMAVFGKLFDKMLSPENGNQHALRAFDLTGYVCERLLPDAAIARAWLVRLVDALTRAEIPEDRKQDVAVAILALAGTRPDPDGIRSARSRLAALGALDGDCPPCDEGKGFLAVLEQAHPFSALWERIHEARTYREQANAYVLALEAGKPGDGYEGLLLSAKDEAPIMVGAFTSDLARRQIEIAKGFVTACPVHHRSLPKIEIGKLRSNSVATARNCCSHVLICLGEE